MEGNKTIKSRDLGEGTSFASYSKIGEPLMAKFAERFIAYTIDWAVLFVILISFSTIVFTTVLYFMHFNYGENILKSIFSSRELVSVMLIILISDIFIGVFYFIYYLNRAGQTPGKMIMNIKVVNKTDLSKLSLAKIIFRETLGRFLSNILFFTGYFYYYYSPKRQTFHDIISDSVVVVLDNDGDIIMTGKDYYYKDGFKAFLPPFVIFLVSVIAALLAINILQFIQRIELRNQIEEVIERRGNVELK